MRDVDDSPIITLPADRKYFSDATKTAMATIKANYPQVFVVGNFETTNVAK